MNERSRIERVVIIFHDPRRFEQVLDAGAMVASQLATALVGIYVEDARLLSAAAQPWSRQFSPLAPGGVRLPPQSLEASWQACARVAKRILQQRAETLALPWHFRTLRVRPDALWQEAMSVGDVAVLGCGVRLGKRPVRRPPIVAENAPEAIALASKLAGPEPMIVLQPSEAPEPTDAALEQIRTLIARRPGTTLVLSSEGKLARSLCRSLDRPLLACDILVVSP